MLLNSYTGQIVEGHPYVDALLWIDRQGMPRPGNELLLELRRYAFDTVIVVHPTPRLAWLMFRARIPVRIGTGYRFYSRLFTHRVFEHRKDARYHELEYNVRLLGALDSTFTAEHLEPEFGLSPDQAAVERVREKLSATGLQPGEQMVVLHPGSGGSARDWPLERFAVLGNRLLQRPGVRIVVTGGKGEEPVVQRVAGEIGRDGVLAFPGTLTLPELAALLSQAALVVANSTGPLHLAVALGTPVVGIYPQLTAMSPARWGPYTSAKRVLVPDAPVDCKECSKGTRCACIESITTEQVLHATLDLLQQTTSQGRRGVAHA
jgi:ADP-heptose:LPS heptosyltransferase